MFLALLLTTVVQAATFNSLYPDPALTPGRFDHDITTKQVCTSGFTKTIRDSSIKTRKEVFRRYGLDWKYAKYYEVDHFFSLLMGGSNDVENLWPERYCPLPRKVSCIGAREKDVVEQYLKRRICKGGLSLDHARAIIKKDWVECYTRIKTGKDCTP